MTIQGLITAIGIPLAAIGMAFAAPATAAVTYVYGDDSGAYFAFTAPTYIQPFASGTAQYCSAGACENDFLRKYGVDILYPGGNTGNGATFTSGAFGADGVYFGLDRTASLVVFSHPSAASPVGDGVTYVYGDDSGAYFAFTAPTHIQPFASGTAQYCSAGACENDFLRKYGVDILYPGGNTGNGATFTLGAFGADGVYFGLDRTASLVVFTAAAAVPEPGSWAMLICGFGLVGAALRRSRTLAGLATPLSAA